MSSSPTAWDVTYDLLRSLGLTTVFGNPGPTEQTLTHCAFRCRGDALPEQEREALLDTLEAWFDHGGSAERAARALYVHPNTVRQRLREVEQRTGRLVTEPRVAAELCIALETTRRAAKPEP
ncbi:hypothetical protein B8W69_15170 [Mycobacterium vulneris]|uniref:PucR C-terminal helix-turn-helix domain-containing protein n=1 Tax=Mycolicibacterium vulneris TaxID=547163 RepID=A0A1X2KYZ1_9MYCO|nr:helix-turn-helix domain-containing protein [Mycolicibacterium vulneris]OSC27016.1 hypothetical protein B8W69_15170 [Mycolicibacterium vulneris]